MQEIIPAIDDYILNFKNEHPFSFRKKVDSKRNTNTNIVWMPTFLAIMTLFRGCGRNFHTTRAGPWCFKYLNWRVKTTIDPKENKNIFVFIFSEPIWKKEIEKKRLTIIDYIKIPWPIQIKSQTIRSTYLIQMIKSGIITTYLFNAY